MSTKPRDMTGSAYCMDCGVVAVHERGPGTPLVIRHGPTCPNLPWQWRTGGRKRDLVLEMWLNYEKSKG